MREMISLFALCTPIDTDTVWADWYRFCMEQEQKYNYVFSHVSCETEILHPNGIRTRSRYLKKVTACIENRDDISFIEFYLLPYEFRQAAFDFKIYMALSLGKHAKPHLEITVENHFLKDFEYQYCLDAVRKFLTVTKAEVNLLPYNQTFNYNMNCILSPADRSIEKVQRYSQALCRVILPNILCPFWFLYFHFFS